MSWRLRYFLRYSNGKQNYHEKLLQRLNEKLKMHRFDLYRCTVTLRFSSLMVTNSHNPKLNSLSSTGVTNWLKFHDIHSVLQWMGWMGFTDTVLKTRVWWYIKIINICADGFRPNRFIYFYSNWLVIFIMHNLFLNSVCGMTDFKFTYIHVKKTVFPIRNIAPQANTQ